MWNIFSDYTTVKDIHQLLFKKVRFSTIGSHESLSGRNLPAAVTSLSLLSGWEVIDTRDRVRLPTSKNVETDMKTRTRNFIIEAPLVLSLLWFQNIPYTFPSLIHQSSMWHSNEPENSSAANYLYPVNKNQITAC